MSVAAIKELVDSAQKNSPPSSPNYPSRSYMGYWDGVKNDLLRRINELYAVIAYHDRGCIVYEFKTGRIITFVNFKRMFDHLSIIYCGKVGTWWLSNPDRRQHEALHDAW